MMNLKAGSVNRRTNWVHAHHGRSSSCSLQGVDLNRAKGGRYAKVSERDNDGRRHKTYGE